MEITQSREPWNKGKLIGQKATTEAEGHLGHSYPSAMSTQSRFEKAAFGMIPAL